MAQKPPQTDPKEREALPPEPLPPIDDDLEPETPPTVAARQGEDEPPEEAAPRRRGDPGRDAITERYKELQAEERAARGDDAPPPDDDAGDGSAGAPQDQAQEPGLSPDVGADDPELELLVFGEVRKIKRSELIKRYELEGFDNARIINIAQKQMAADQRLAEAKKLADQRGTEPQAPRSAGEVDDGSETDQSSAPHPDDADGLTPDRPPQGQNQPFNEEQLDDIVQRVQFGGPDEAKQALLDFAGEIKKSNPAATPEQVLDLFERRLAQQQHQTEIYDALKRFGDANPDLAQNTRLVQVGLDIAAEEMVKDLKAIGLTDEHINPLLAAPTPQEARRQISIAHRAVRLQGHKVRSFDQLLEAAGTSLRTEFNLPKQGAGSQPNPNPQPGTPPRERLHRKEILQPQPRHGGARAAPAQPQRPKTAIELINEQRANRGFQSV